MALLAANFPGYLDDYIDWHLDMDDLFTHTQHIGNHPHIGALFLAWLGGGKEGAADKPAAQTSKVRDYPGAFEDFCSAWGAAGGTSR